jgi:hypothetical protein
MPAAEYGFKLLLRHPKPAALPGLHLTRPLADACDSIGLPLLAERAPRGGDRNGHNSRRGCLRS